ncbi:MAG: LysE family translocator [Proteobacteria bacterium]|nr:LysE family translocator [Pseudomonadota bacterium]
MFPTDPTVLAGFLATAVAVVISPGPDTIIILRHSLGSGRGAGLAAVLGVQLGLVVHTMLAVVGISLIIASSPVLLNGLASIGAAYLAWLGFKSLKGGGGLTFDAAGAAAGNSGRALREAALCNLLNPKVILLFLALFPNFIDYQRGNVTEQLIGLSVILIVINTIWQAPMALAADALRRWMANPAVLNGVNRASGATLLIMAALMLGQNLR